MKNKILTRALVGFAAGVAAHLLLTVVFSLFAGDGNYHALLPQVIRTQPKLPHIPLGALDFFGVWGAPRFSLRFELSSLLTRVLAQYGLAGGCGAVWGACSLVWRTNWNIFLQSGLSLLLCSGASFAYVYLTGLLPRAAIWVAMFFLAFLIVFHAVRRSRYSAVKNSVRELNERLRVLHKQ